MSTFTLQPHIVGLNLSTQSDNVTDQSCFLSMTSLIVAAVFSAAVAWPSRVVFRVEGKKHKFENLSPPSHGALLAVGDDVKIRCMLAQSSW